MAKLFYREKGKGKLLILLHGLWGASENWLPVANLLSEHFRVVLPDMRNHGSSFHADRMDYDAMCQDVVDLIEEQEERPYIVGHSMGGKVVMALLLTRPELIEKAVVVDIAPVTYSGKNVEEHMAILNFITGLDLSKIKDRKELGEAIGRSVFPEHIRQLLLKNMRKGEMGFEWKINHTALAGSLRDLMGWPEELLKLHYTGELLFVKGEDSDMITDFTGIKNIFPRAQLMRITDCGHWVHVDQPEAISREIKFFLCR